MKRKSKAILSTLAAMTLAMSSCPGILPEASPLPSISLVAEAAATKYYKVNVTGGTLSNGKTSGSAKESQYITVTADAAPEGKKFSHWERNGQEASTDSTYSFRMPSSAVNLEAVFVDEEKYIYPGGRAIIESAKSNKTTGKLTFTAALNIPSDCTFVKGGLVATNDHNVGSAVSAYTATYVKLATKGTEKTKSLKYTWTKGSVTEDQIWYVRAYLVYKDADGEEITVYGDCVKYGLNGDMSNENGAFFDETTGIMTLKGHVTDYDIRYYKYNSNLTEIYAEPGTVLPESCDSLFSSTSAKKIDISNADTSNAKDMQYMFAWNYSLEELNVSGIDTSNVTNMRYMFASCSKLETLDLSSFDTSNVENMEYMFYYSSNLKSIDVSNFDTGNVTTMYEMFYYCPSLEELDVSDWDTSNVTDMSSMFYYNQKLTDIDISGWDLSSLENAYYMFYECESISSVDLECFDLSNLESASYMFGYCKNLKTVKFGEATRSNLRWINGMFFGCESLESADISDLDISSVTSLYGMFCNCKQLTSIDISSFDTGNVTDMSSMFASCSSLESIDFGDFDTSNVKDMSYMFSDCNSLEDLDLSSFDTSNVTDMLFMFAGCKKLESLDLNSFDTSSVTKMGEMFFGCASLKGLDLRSFDTSNVINMEGMFCFCSNLENLDISSFNTSKVTKMREMFRGCTVLPYVNLSSFDMSNVTNYTDMFSASPLLLANCNSYYAQYLTKGYQTTIRTIFTPSENAKTVIVSVGDRSEEFNIEDIPDYSYSPDKKDLSYSFVSNRTKSTDYFRIKVLDAEGRTLPFNNSYGKPYSYCTSECSLSDITRNIYRVTKVVGDQSTYTDYNTAKSHPMDKMLLGDMTLPEGYKLVGWEVKCSAWSEDYSSIYTLTDNRSFWTYLDTTGDTTFTAILAEKEHTVPVTLPLNTPTAGHYEYDDYDLFAFTAEEAGTYVFTPDSPKFIFANLYADAEMQDFIVSNNNGNGYGKFRVQVDLEKGQTVYLRPVGNNVVTDIFDYTVNVRKMRDEPVKTFTLALDGTETGHYEDCEEYDIFSFTAEEDGVYLFTGENTEGGICGELYNDAELTDSISSYYGDSGPFTIRAELTAGQTVYLRPTGYNSYESCDYTVSIAKKVIVAREAIALTLDTETEGNFEDIDDYDRFSFTAEEDGTYIFKGTTSQMRDIYGYLYSDEAMTESFDIDGGYPSWTDYYVYFTIRVDLTAGQTVYLKPAIDDGNGSCDYTVSVKKWELDAIEMTLDTPIPGHFENSDEFDSFSFTAPSEGTYIFTSDCYYDTFGYLFSDEGLKEMLALNDDDGGNGQFRIEYYLEEGQTVYLLPIRYNWGDSCDYTVTVEKCLEPLDIYSIEELDATISIDPAKESEKTNFSCNSSTAYVKIDGYDTVDDSSVTVTYGIDLELDPNEAEYEIVLYDGSGNGIISVNNYSLVKSVNFTVFSDCAYIKITRLDGEAIGNATIEYTYLGRYSSGDYR